MLSVVIDLLSMAWIVFTLSMLWLTIPCKLQRPLGEVVNVEIPRLTLDTSSIGTIPSLQEDRIRPSPSGTT
jgi:hypothetical protein